MANITQSSNFSERALWCSVISQALLDLKCRERNMENTKARAEAISWFTSRKADFVRVCDFAGVDSDSVVRFAQQVMSGTAPLGDLAALTARSFRPRKRRR